MDPCPYVFGKGKQEEDACRFDEGLGVVIHCFAPGSRRCKCKERVVRTPVGDKMRMKFGRQAYDPDYKD